MSLMSLLKIKELESQKKILTLYLKGFIELISQEIKEREEQE